ncbi:carboxypeptidase D [Perkinsela sp. CCAP 1560/4]|nr:carboxypeptidase D [Perkinsela sp. CCAP 1560/4]|eukprot:KNH09785.1 carboxypeptidase D [Perkinsela sp. CCAP 1560/4]
MNKSYFVIEHLETALPKWAMLEYKHLVHNLMNVYSCPIEVVFTSVSAEQVEFQRMFEEIACMYDHFEKHTQSQPFGLAISFPDLKKSVSLSSLSAIDYIHKECHFLSKKDSSQSPVVVILDPLAEEELTPIPVSPEETTPSEKNSFFVFGGILGDHPMNGRTFEELTKTFLHYKDTHNSVPFDLHYKHLGKLQMTTDTAVLVTAAICIDKFSLNSISYIDEPRIVLSSVEQVKMKGFRYLSSIHKHDERFSQTVSSALFPNGLVDLLKEDYTIA